MTAIELLKKWRAEIAANAELGMWEPAVDDDDADGVTHELAVSFLRDAFIASHTSANCQETRLRVYDAAIARLEGESNQ